MNITTTQPALNSVDHATTSLVTTTVILTEIKNAWKDGLEITVKLVLVLFYTPLDPETVRSMFLD